MVRNSFLYYIRQLRHENNVWGKKILNERKPLAKPIKLDGSKFENKELFSPLVAFVTKVKVKCLYLYWITLSAT